MTRILGIDFSGDSDAGARIWIAAGRREDGPLSVTDCRPAMQLPGGARAPGIALSALRTHVLTDADTIAGCDFPFSLPAELVRERYLLPEDVDATVQRAYEHWELAAGAATTSASAR